MLSKKVSLAGIIAYFLVTNGELALGTLMLLRKCLELLDRLALGYCRAELDVRLRILVSRLQPEIVRLVFLLQQKTKKARAEGVRLHTKTLVSSGSEARTSFNALCISCAVPSKNRPHPMPPCQHPNRRTASCTIVS